MTQNGKVETGLPSLFPLQYSAAIVRLEYIFLLSADLIFSVHSRMRAIIAVPRRLSLFPFPFHLPNFFFITGSDLNHSSVLCSQFKTRSYPSAGLFVDFGSFSACGHCSLPSDHKKQARTCWCSNNTTSALWGYIFFSFSKYTNITEKTWF